MSEMKCDSYAFVGCTARAPYHTQGRHAQNFSPRFAIVRPDPYLEFTAEVYTRLPVFLFDASGGIGPEAGCSRRTSIGTSEPSVRRAVADADAGRIVEQLRLACLQRHDALSRRHSSPP